MILQHAERGCKVEAALGRGNRATWSQFRQDAVFALLQHAADLLVSAVAKFEAALVRGDRSGGRVAGMALAKLAAAAPSGDPSLQATLEVQVWCVLRNVLQEVPAPPGATAAEASCIASVPPSVVPWTSLWALSLPNA